MKNKKIYKVGLVLGRLEETYQAMVWPSISQYAHKHKIELYIFTGNSMGEIDEYCLNYDNLKYLISPSTMDGLIIMTGAMGDFFTNDEIIDYCKQFQQIPMITIAIKLPNVPCIMIDNKNGMKDMVTHLIIDHNYKKIAFIKGPNDHDEANERFQAYKEALQENNIEYNQKLVAPGDFTKQAGMKAINLFLNKNHITPDAIVAVDDDTAIGALIVLNKKKLHDIKIAGFDNTEEAQLSIPSLTTVNQPLGKQGAKALELLLKKIKNEEIPEKIYLPTEIVIRQSCGCQPEAIRAYSYNKNKKIKINNLSPEALSLLTIIQSTATVDQKAVKILEELKQIALLSNKKSTLIKSLNDILISLHKYTISEIKDTKQQFEIEHLILKSKIFISEIEKSMNAFNKSEEKYKIWLLRQIGQTLISNFELSDLLITIEQGLKLLQINSCYICSFNQNNKKKSKIHEKSTLIFAFQNKKLLDIHKFNTAFQTNIILPGIIQEKKNTNTHIIMPLYFQEEQFGYIIFELSPGDKNVYESLRGYISSAIKGTNLFYERRMAERKLITALAKLEIANKQLQDVSITDELTGLLNRRGFNSFGKKEFDISKRLNKTFLLFFFDLDGLKTINDTYGHKEGDFAIKYAADILYKSFRHIDIISRLGGDEFVVMVLESTTKNSKSIIQRFNNLLNEFNEINKKPFKISISYGFIEFNLKAEYSFEELIEMADKKQYKNKIANKKARE